jgi:hypothetical protein
MLLLSSGTERTRFLTEHWRDRLVLGLLASTRCGGVIDGRCVSSLGRSLHFTFRTFRTRVQRLPSLILPARQTRLYTCSILRERVNTGRYLLLELLRNKSPLHSNRERGATEESIASLIQFQQTSYTQVNGHMNLCSASGLAAEPPLSPSHFQQPPTHHPYRYLQNDYYDRFRTLQIVA